MFAPHMEQAGCDTGSNNNQGTFFQEEKQVVFCLIVALPHCYMHAAHLERRIQGDYP